MAAERTENANLILVNAKFENRLQSAIEGLTPYFQKLLLKIPTQNSVYIVDYVINDLKKENNASINYIRMNVYAIVDLAIHSKKQDLKTITRENTLSYLDSLKKSETEDQMHKWIGTHSLHRLIITKFFKWLYSPHIEPQKRPKPKVVLMNPITR